VGSQIAAIGVLVLGFEALHLGEFDQLWHPGRLVFGAGITLGLGD